MTKTRIAYLSDNPTLNPIMIFQRIKRGNLDYIFGRFYTFRKLYSKYRKVQQIVNGKKELLAMSSQIHNLSGLETKDIADFIERNSYFDLLEIKDSVVNLLLEESKKRELFSPAHSQHFKYDDYFNKLKSTQKIAIAEVVEPLDIAQVYNLSCDRFLLDVAENYLGYYPERCDVRLWWSFADDLSKEDRRNQYQTIDYHYDIHGFNFFYVNFYLTNVDSDSGAHVLIRSSHRQKPLKMLLRSSRFPDQFIEEVYPQQDVIVVEGKAGKCFLEDASCLHKALPPVTKDRLFLQFRYF